MTERPFLPNKAVSIKFCLVIGVCSWGLAIVELIFPRATAPTGRWSWLIAPIYETLGAFGLAILWFIVGLILVAPSLKKDH